jgi:hypothetical protein
LSSTSAWTGSDVRLRTKLVGVGALLLVAFAAFGTWRWTQPAPEFREGDIIFQTSRSQQSRAILIASRSLYTHMGIVKQRQDGWVVVEAVGPVKETLLEAWIARGKFGRYALYRPVALTDAQRAQVFAAADRLYGSPYDLHFSFDNEAIYCSELIWLAFGEAGIELGRREKVADILISAGVVRRLISTRAESDEQCLELGLRDQACIDHVLERELVTPVSIARDADLRKIYSNYPI